MWAVIASLHCCKRFRAWTVDHLLFHSTPNSSNCRRIYDHSPSSLGSRSKNSSSSAVGAVLSSPDAIFSFLAKRFSARWIRRFPKSAGYAPYRVRVDIISNGSVQDNARINSWCGRWHWFTWIFVHRKIENLVGCDRNINKGYSIIDGAAELCRVSAL